MADLADPLSQPRASQEQQRLTHAHSARDTRANLHRATCEDGSMTPAPGHRLDSRGSVGGGRAASAGAAGGTDGSTTSPVPSWLAPSLQVPPLAEPAPLQPLPAADVPPSDISTMANLILSAHHAPGHRCSSTSPNGQLYVDALGNPLGPTSDLELPNIKDDMRGAGMCLESHGSSSSSQRQPGSDTDELSVVSTVLPIGRKVEVASAQARSESDSPAEVLVSTWHTPAIHVRASVVVTHECSPASARSSRMGTEQNVERNDWHSGRQQKGCYVKGGSSSSSNSSSGAVNVSSHQGHDMQGDGDEWMSYVADAAAGGAATPPREADAGQRSARGCQDSVDSPAHRSSASGSVAPRQRRGGGSSAGDEPPLAPPLEESEELLAELEQCLDTIKWCASTVRRDSLQDLKNERNPVPVVKYVLEAVSILLGTPETKWDRLKNLISSRDFPGKVHKLNPQQNVTKEQFRRLRERLRNQDFDEELIKTVCVPVVPLAM